MPADPTIRYVLVTPVRNEEVHLPRTIESVLAQTILPVEWVIVSDGSTDRTNAIISEAAATHSWIRLLALPPRTKASFAAVVRNTESGIRHLTNSEYDFIGLLDSDLAFQSDYFARLIDVFAANPKLGLAGGVAIDIGRSKDQLPRNRQDVPGALQFFRRSCFEAIGGLIPIPEGGWDSLTCAMARMHGFETRLVTELIVDHLKPRNISQGGAIRRKWQMGVRDHAIGYHPVFELVKCVGRTTEPPFLLAAGAWWLGFCWATVAGGPRVVPMDVVRHVRREQTRRLTTAFRSG